MKAFPLIVLAATLLATPALAKKPDGAGGKGKADAVHERNALRKKCQKEFVALRKGKDGDKTLKHGEFMAKCTGVPAKPDRGDDDEAGPVKVKPTK